MLELATQYESGEPVRVGSIADAHDIPSRFLVQILLQLKSAGFVASTRGAAGGYRLIKAPESVTLADVMCVFEPSLTAKPTTSTTPSAESSVLTDVWSTAAQTQLEALQAVTYADLMERVRGRSDNMYYI